MKKIIIVIFSIFISACSSVEFKGTSKDSFFFPENQSWMVVDAKPLDKSSKKSGQALRFYLTSFVHFSDNYFTTRSFNSGRDMVIGSCFEKDREKLTAYPVGIFKKYAGEQLEFKFHRKNITVVLPNKIEITLSRVPDEIQDKVLPEKKIKSHKSVISKIEKKYKTIIECKK